uniref:Nfc104 n=1 Tax=Arundo donax TaxID=35708 RepID=A0A0A9CM36_ARUDO
MLIGLEMSSQRKMQMTVHRSCCSFMEATRPRYQSCHGILVRNGSLPAWLKITSCRSGRWQKASTVMTTISTIVSRVPLHKRHPHVFCGVVGGIVWS